MHSHANLKLPIYLDYNATTPVDPAVFVAMRPYFCEAFGNAASKSHSFGWSADAAVRTARQQAGAILHAEPDSIIWTSGSTESNNLAIKGVACELRDKGRHLITQAGEHKAVLDPFKRLKDEGCDITVLPVDRGGQIDLDELKRAIRPDTILVSIMWANNEIGTIYPIREIGKLCRERGVLLHTDATQAVGKIPVNVDADFIDLLSFSAHKLYGPKGSGGLFVRRDGSVKMAPLFHGGGHECGFRSGTLNVPGIVGLGKACEIAMQRMSSDQPRLGALRDRLERGIREQIDGVQINGDPSSRLPHMTSLSFEGLPAEMSGSLMPEDIAVSNGSACTSACPQPSHVLRACGLSDNLAANSLRFSFGRTTTSEEVDHAIQKTIECVTNLRALASMTAGATVR